MSAASLIEAARTRLGDAPREALGELIEPRRVLGIGRSLRIVRRGAAWHLGVLLLTDEAVLATGDVVRAREEVLAGEPWNVSSASVPAGPRSPSSRMTPPSSTVAVAGCPPMSTP